jgi:UPF0716 family protein affecting phage T7 exclusion
MPQRSAPPLALLRLSAFLGAAMVRQAGARVFGNAALGHTSGSGTGVCFSNPPWPAGAWLP